MAIIRHLVSGINKNKSKASSQQTAKKINYDFSSITRSLSVTPLKSKGQIDNFRKNLLQKIPDIQRKLQHSDSEQVNEACIMILRSLCSWPPSSTKLQRNFIDSLGQLFFGQRVHFQYIMLQSGEFIAGGTHEAIRNMTDQKQSLQGGNISLRAIEKGKIELLIDAGSSTVGEQMGSRSSAPHTIAKKINHYIPPELRPVIKFIPVSGTKAIQ